MALSYKTENICTGADYTEIIDQRFKTNCIYVNLIVPMDKDTASANAMVPLILKDTNEKYPTMTMLSRKLSSLYDTSVLGNVSKIGGNQVISLLAWSIADKYTIDGEKISNEVTDILLDCLTKPYLKNGCFPEEDFKLKQQELLDEIDAEINDKRSYAQARANEIAFEDEPAGIYVNGSREAAEALTAADVYKRYRELLKTAYIKVVFTGHDISADNKKKLFDKVRSLERSAVAETVYTRSAAKASIRECTEKFDVAQAKAVMVFKSDLPESKRTVLKMFSAVYGGTPFSLLFDNVRERLSLCYYCSSSYVGGKNAVFISSGVEFDNIKAAENEILNQLEVIKKGGVTEKLLEDTKRYFRMSMKSIYDRPSTMAYYFLGQFVFDKVMTPEEEAAEADKVTLEDITEAANSLTLDTVYILTGKDNETNE